MRPAWTTCSVIAQVCVRVPHQVAIGFQRQSSHSKAVVNVIVYCVALLPSMSRLRRVPVDSELSRLHFRTTGETLRIHWAVLSYLTESLVRAQGGRTGIAIICGTYVDAVARSSAPGGLRTASANGSGTCKRCEQHKDWQQHPERRAVARRITERRVSTCGDVYILKESQALPG